MDRGFVVLVNGMFALDIDGDGVAGVLPETSCAFDVWRLETTLIGRLRGADACKHSTTNQGAQS
ncbi:hypothetical protein [Rhodopseudomonas sp. B29]|uniref:hypothetical protein n=1 Tax=Rhodopseudomonas sp. B29 TaxID=95607 RepID=UPI0003484827|nr:hypothetical protein [Rhodopseudomonas sp. B29]